MNAREIHCEACGKTALARPEPVYQGFKKIGEVFVCIACGHRYASEAETPFLPEEEKGKVFSSSDSPNIPRIFSEEERHHCCLYCAHYVVSPFYQRCGLTNRLTEATDICVRFKEQEQRKDPL